MPGTTFLLASVYRQWLSAGDAADVALNDKTSAAPFQRKILIISEKSGKVAL